jgi:hypothetical protein
MLDAPLIVPLKSIPRGGGLPDGVEISDGGRIRRLTKVQVQQEGGEEGEGIDEEKHVSST